MSPRNVVGMLLGDLLDVDPAPHHAGVELVCDRRLRVDQHTAGHVAVYLEAEDVLRLAFGVLRGVGELDAAGLHPAAGQDLRLDHDRTRDLLGDLARLLRRRGEAVLGDRDSRLGDDRPGLVLEEAHRRAGRLAIAVQPRSKQILSTLLLSCPSQESRLTNTYYGERRAGRASPLPCTSASRCGSSSSCPTARTPAPAARPALSA